MSRQVILNQFLLIDVFLIVINICFPLFILLQCKLLQVCLRNEFLIKAFIIQKFRDDWWLICKRLEK